MNPNGNALIYSTYLGGGSDDYSDGIAVDSGGNAYVTGLTYSTDFPTANAFQGSSHGGSYDAFVAKLNPSGGALVYSTYLGGSGYEAGQAIAVDSGANAYVTGNTSSHDFPTANALQGTNHSTYGANAFVTKINSSGGGLVYSTYLGGGSNDYGYGIAVDGGGNAYATGLAQSTDFPTANALQGTNRGALSGYAGSAFVSKLSANGGALTYSTYLGGYRDNIGRSVAVDAAGDAYVTGETNSPDFPTANAPQGTYNGATGTAFASELNASGGALIYSSYLGGSGRDYGLGIAVAAVNNAYVTGYTSSADFPTTTAIQRANGGGYDAFVAKVDPSPVVTATLDDGAQGAGLNQWNYVGGGWAHCTAPPSGTNCDPSYYNNTNSTDPITGDYATLAFSGVGVTYYATKGANRGIVAVSVDGGPETLVDLYSAATGGNVAVYASPPLANGPHTLKVRVTGTQNASSAGAYVTIDRADIAAPTTRAVALNAEGPAAGPYAADADYSGGNYGAAAAGATIDTSAVVNPAPQAVYQTERWGTFGYSIPNLVPGASYTVRLHFAETFFTGPGQRTFNVAVNGRPVLSNFDIFVAAGGMNKAIVEGTTTTADSTGKIAIQFTGVVADAKVNGIEVLANPQINSGGGLAAPFVPDTAYSGGYTYANANAIDTGAVNNPAPRAVYQSERWGVSTYVAPGLLPGGAYTVRLHFAEIAYNAAGQRVFNVAINGAPALTNFDIVAAAGTANRALVKEFPATADANGRIAVAYNAVVDNPKSSGIEVVAQVPTCLPGAPAGPNPGVITTVAGTSTWGFSGDSCPAPQARLDYPTGVAVDKSGNVYITDASNKRVREVMAGTGLIRTVAGTGNGGFSGDGGPATAAQLSIPYGLAVDGAGNLYIADSGNNRVREVLASTGVITTVAGTGNYGSGGDGGPATGAQLYHPIGVAVDNADDVFIADYGNNRVREALASTGIITTVAGTGSYSYGGDGGPATSAQVAYPWGVGVDGLGNIGGPPIPGRQSFAGGTWRVQSVGGDVYGTADQFRYVWQTATGDGSMSARVAAQANTGPCAKAGVMYRAGADPGAVNYMVELTPNCGGPNTVSVQYRSAQGGATTAIALAGALPQYLKVTRAGNMFTAFTSSDGSAWTAVPGSSVTLGGMPAAALAGMAVTSYNATASSAATFDAVTFSA